MFESYSGHPLFVSVGSLIMSISSPHRLLVHADGQNKITRVVAYKGLPPISVQKIRIRLLTGT